MKAPFPDFEYRFSCTACGDCCRGKQAVPLNRHDLILMAQNRQLKNTKELFETGICEVRCTETGYWRPYIRFKTKPIRMCPFLENEVLENGQVRGLCQLHPIAKPLICHLAPLGRIIDLSNGNESWQLNEPSPGCPGMNQGAARTLHSDIRVFQQRLKEEAQFFLFLEQNSPNCPDPTSAIKNLFSIDIL